MGSFYETALLNASLNYFLWKQCEEHDVSLVWVIGRGSKSSSEFIHFWIFYLSGVVEYEMRTAMLMQFYITWSCTIRFARRNCSSSTKSFIPLPVVCYTDWLIKYVTVIMPLLKLIYFIKKMQPFRLSNIQPRVLHLDFRLVCNMYWTALWTKNIVWPHISPDIYI